MALNIEVLEQSFDKIKPHATEFADTFYHNLFLDYPQVQPLFAHTNMTEQKKHLISALSLVVANLSNPEALQDALKAMGARHVNYGTLEEHYPIIGANLLKAFESHLKEDWTTEVKQAWVDAYQAITMIMLQGATEKG